MFSMEELFTLGVIPFIGLVIVFFIKKLPMGRAIVFLAAYVYFLLVIGVTLLPIRFGVEPMPGQGYAYNFIPFQSILSSFRDGLRSTLRAVAGNIVLFLPLGALLPLIERKNSCFWRCLLIALLCSVCIELSQYLLGLGVGYRYRNVDVDDLLLNTLGGALGWGIYQLVPRAWKKPFERKTAKE